jgi:hypothetical protein
MKDIIQKLFIIEKANKSIKINQEAFEKLINNFESVCENIS